MDLGETFTASQAYVMLSRVEDINQLVIMDRIKVKSIRINPDALKELEKMNARSINNNPTIWSRKEGTSTKIAVLNVMNLRNNFRYAAQDSTLLLADLICFSETCMTTEADERTCTIEGYNAYFNSAGNGKGIVGFCKRGVFQHEADQRLGLAQLTLFTSRDINVIHVYRSQHQPIDELLRAIEILRRKDRTTVVCGDLNLCLRKQPTNQFTLRMQDWGLSQIVKDATHIQGGHIDHVYVSSEVVGKVNIERTSPFYSDHDTLCVTIVEQVP